MKTFGKISCAVCVVAVLVMVSASAQAGVITYADFAAYNAASIGNTTLDLNTFPNGLPFPAGENWYNGPYVSTTGVKIASAGGMYTVAPPMGGWGWLPSGGLETQIATIITQLPANTTAVAFNLLDCNFGPSSVVLTIGGVEQAPIVVAGVDQSYVFFGATSDQPIEQIKVNDSCGWGFVDNVTYGTANVPEPATMTMLVLGGLATLLRRKR